MIKIYSNIKKIIKNKKGYAQSSEYVIFFTITVLLVLIMIQIIMALFTIYNANIAATNIARVVSVNGGFSDTQGTQIYSIANNQLHNRVEDDSVEVTLSSTSLTDEDVVLSNVSQSHEYQVNLGEDFDVTVSAEVTLFTIAGRDVNARVASSSSGVGEVYHKDG